jgi:hypothetical protein
MILGSYQDVGLVYDSRELSGVTTAKLRVAGVLHAGP